MKHLICNKFLLITFAALLLAGAGCGPNRKATFDPSTTESYSRSFNAMVEGMSMSEQRQLGMAMEKLTLDAYQSRIRKGMNSDQARSEAYAPLSGKTAEEIIAMANAQ